MKKLIPKFIGGFINLTAHLFPKWNANYSFELLCKVRRVGISEKGQLFFNEGETMFLPVDNNKQEVGLHRWGNGPKKLLFLHGWMSNSQRWLPYVKELDLNEYSVYALDAPGHGVSKGTKLNLEIYRESVVKAINEIGDIDVLVAHSFGCLASAYAYLNDNALSIKKYITMGAPVGMDAIFVYFRELLGLSNKAIQNLDTKISSILKIPHKEINMNHFFETVKRPILVIHDKKDRITPFAPIEKASTEKPGVTTFFISDQDHNLKGEATVNRVLDFIRE